MKNILVLIAVLGFVACSSKEKKENNEMAAEQTQATESQANDEAKKAYDEAQKEAEAAAQKAAQDGTTGDEAGASTSGDFGPYEGTEKSKFTCTSGEDVRTVAVLDGTEGGCGVVYNKMGADRTIAVAQYDMEFCPEVQNKVKGNLEAAGFTCE